MVAPSSRWAAATGSTASSAAGPDALIGQILPRPLTRVTDRLTIHRMMTSSRDELTRRGTTPAVSIEHLRVIRGKRPALHDFCVEIAPGTITGLLGPSGCGKSTLIRSIVGTQIVTSGSVTVLGQPAGSAALRRRVGYVPQDPTVYDDLRIIDNVRYFAALYGMDSSAADAAIDAVGLSDHRTALCGNLSGGQRTRAS